MVPAGQAAGFKTPHADNEVVHKAGCGTVSGGASPPDLFRPAKPHEVRLTWRGP